MTVNSEGFLSETQLLTEMVPYSISWKPSFFSWNNHEISVLLPSDIKYSRKMITTQTEKGYTSTHDWADASAGIPVSRSGSVNLHLICKTKQVASDKITTTTQSQVATLSLSFLSKNDSKEEYLGKIKEKSLQVLSQTGNSAIVRKRNDNSYFYETIEKTVVSQM